MTIGVLVGDEEFITAIAALYAATDTDDLCAILLSVLPVSGLSVTTLADPFGSETVCASDGICARLDEIQIDLGEGPSWEAMRTRKPVFEPDLQAATSEVWPVVLLALQETRIGAVFAFPMQLGPLTIGTVNLYNRSAGALAVSTAEDTVALTNVAARQVLHRSLARADRANDGDDRDGNLYSRREVYQASGMLAAQTGAGAGDALLLLRAYAFADSRTVRDLSAAVLARTIDFTDRNDFAP